MTRTGTWPASVPSDWVTVKSQYALDPVRRDPLPDDDILTAFRDGTVTLRKNRREEGFTNAAKEIGYQRIEPGDLVVHSMDGGFGAIGVSDSAGKASPVVHAYRSAYCDVYFLAYFLRAAVSSGWIAAQGKGIRERSTQFDRPSLSRLDISFPPLPTQRAIADYLDRETAQIDAMTAELDELVATLEERRVAASSTAVRDGQNRYPRKSVQTLVEMHSGDAISSSKITKAGAIPVFGGNGPRGFTKTSNSATDKVLIGRQGALCGNVHIARAPFWATEHAIVCELRVKVDVRWLAHSLRDLNLGRLSTAAAQPGISATAVGREIVPFPPLSQQGEIADYLDKITAEIDSMIADAQELKALLSERRSALITEVVTGRKEVPTS